MPPPSLPSVSPFRTIIGLNSPTATSSSVGVSTSPPPTRTPLGLGFRALRDGDIERDMEVLSPSPPPSPAIERYGGARGAFQAALRRVAGDSYGREGAEARIHVAVGRSPEKTLGLLRWAFRRFGCTEIGLVHVHQPSPVIPTLLGKIPAAQATEELVLSHRKSEKEEMKQILLSYLSFCYRAQVQASLVLTENDQIHDGIATLVKDHGIRKLIMGCTPDSCFKLKASYSKASFTAKNAPAFCEIWFIYKGRHIWTREASSAADPFISAYNQDDAMLRNKIRFRLTSNNAESILNEGDSTYETSTATDLYRGRGLDNGGFGSLEALFTCDANFMYSTNISNLQDAASTLSSPFWHDSSVDIDMSKLYSKDLLNDNLKQVMMEGERSKKEAFAELVKRKEIESKVADAFTRVQVSESAQKQEINRRKELEVLLVDMRKQHADHAKRKEAAMRGLDSARIRLASLDAHSQTVALCMEKAVTDLEVIQSSIEILRHEKPKTVQQDRNVDQVGGWRYGNHVRWSNCNLTAPDDDSYNFREFTLSDLRAATCEFSESFNIGSGGHVGVYKGELMNRSVVIQKLRSRSSQSLMQFQQEVYILSKVKHRNLLTLIGVCPEALALVYEYLPNGSLQDCLFSKGSIPSLTWKIRACIVGEISSALLFLHSSKPGMIVHGNLKLENILLDSDFHCKIADFGISRLVMEDMMDYPLFHGSSELKRSFPYADPECERTMLLTPKSDIYSFGIIILQLLTRKQPLGLVNEVRRAMSSDKLSSILDPTAGEWPIEVAQRLAEFGLQCSESSSRDRPELTSEIVGDLEQLYFMKERQVPSYFLCPIFKEIMYDPQVAADGFTYDRRAIREWLDNGGETSPMTNLKLKHLNLIPNHALRFAIEDWLCQC